MKTLLRKYLGETLTVAGLGLFVLNILRDQQYRYYQTDTLVMISLGVMLIVSGLFIFINKRKNS